MEADGELKDHKRGRSPLEVNWKIKILEDTNANMNHWYSTIH